MAYGLLAPVDYLSPTPVVMGAGTCMAHDPRGVVGGFGRYIYVLFSMTAFYRYDIWTDTWQRLADPAAAGGELYGAAVAMCADPSRSQLFVFIPRAGDTRLLTYDVATDIWVNNAGPAVAGWGTSAALLHLCSLENQTVADDALYLIGNNAVAMYQGNIGTGAWALVVPTVARGGAAGAGTTLNWLPTLSPNVFYSLRGGGSAVLDMYAIAAGVWAAEPPDPETFNLGTCSAPDPITPGIAVYRDATMQLREIYILPGTITPAIQPLATYPGVDGVAHAAQALTSVRADDGTAWFYFAKHGGNTFMRAQRML